MSVDVIAAGLIGIAGTLLGGISEHFLNGRREKQAKVAENWGNVVQEVYSPLIFDLRLIKDRGTLRELRVLGKTLPQLSKKQTKEQVTNFAIFILGITKQNQSKLLRETLRKKVGQIRPKDLWEDLFTFYDSLDFLEDTISTLSTGLVGEKPDEFMANIQGCIRTGATLDEATEHLIDSIEQLCLMDKTPPKVKYDVFFTKDVRKALAGTFDKVPSNLISQAGNQQT